MSSRDDSCAAIDARVGLRLGRGRAARLVGGGVGVVVGVVGTGVVVVGGVVVVVVVVVVCGVVSGTVVVSVAVVWVRSSLQSLTLATRSRARPSFRFSTSAGSTLDGRLSMPSWTWRSCPLRSLQSPRSTNSATSASWSLRLLASAGGIPSRVPPQAMSDEAARPRAKAQQSNSRGRGTLIDRTGAVRPGMTGGLRRGSRRPRPRCHR